VLLTCTEGTEIKSMRSNFERLVGSLLVTSFWLFGNLAINSVNLERKRMIRKASARSVRNMPRHGHNEQEALERMARNGSVTRDPTEKQTSREHRSVGSAIKANFFYLSQIS
jgi:hypothetical protein